MRTPREKSRRVRKEPSGLSALTPRLRAGRLTAEQFFRATEADFARLAYRLRAGYDLPATVDLDDVAQELRMQFLAALPDWKPEAGADLYDYASIRAHQRTRKWLDKQRCNRNGGPSRHPLLLIDAVEQEERERLYAGTCWGSPPEAADELIAAQEAERDVRLLAAALDMTAEEFGVEVTRRQTVRDRALTAAAEIGVGFFEGKIEAVR